MIVLLFSALSVDGHSERFRPGPSSNLASWSGACLWDVFRLVPCRRWALREVLAGTLQQFSELEWGLFMGCASFSPLSSSWLQSFVDGRSNAFLIPLLGPEWRPRMHPAMVSLRFGKHRMSPVQGGEDCHNSL